VSGRKELTKGSNLASNSVSESEKSQQVPAHSVKVEGKKNMTKVPKQSTVSTLFERQILFH
jgi:hypothetical protein